MVFHCFHGFLSLYTANKVLPVLARLSPGRPSASAQHTDQALRGCRCFAPAQKHLRDDSLKTSTKVLENMFEIVVFFFIG